MKRNWLFSTLLLFILLSSALEARTKWGLGFMVGAPTVTAHLAIPAGEHIGIDVDFSWSLWDTMNNAGNGSSIYGIMDIIAWNPTLGVPEVRFLIGFGMAMGIWIQEAKKADDGFFVGARIPLGFEWIPSEHFESFIKIGPGVILFPSSSFRIDIGIGGRYIF